MPSSTPHQKFSFYHLPTRGWAGIKLGDAWYVSNISIIFDCSMLYYLLFWTILGFIFHFYIIFGTNLLTGGPTQNCCFFAYFSVSDKQNIKRSPNGIKSSETWFSRQTWSRRLGPHCKGSKRWSRGWGRPPIGCPPIGRAPCLVGPSVLHRRTPSSTYYFSVSDKPNIKRSPNGIKSSETWFSHRTWIHDTWTLLQGTKEAVTRVGAPPLGRAPCLVGPSLLLRRTSSSYIYTRTPKRSEQEPKT